MKLLNQLLNLLTMMKLLIVVDVESVVVEAVDCCRLLCALESSSFVETVESVVVEAVDCCRLDYGSSFVEAVESVVVEDVDWFVSYIMWSREL